MFLHADSEESDQTRRMWADAQADLSLRWAQRSFWCFVMRRLICILIQHHLALRFSVLWPHMIQFSGKLCGTQKEMHDLVTAHGAKIGKVYIFFESGFMVVVTPYIQVNCRSGACFGARVSMI